MQLQRFALLLALPLLICLSACMVIIPVERGDEELFKDERLTFIEIGKSTKEDIATAMSDFPMEKDEGEASVKLTPKKFRDGDWWLYTQTRQETKWLFAALSPGGAGADIIGGVDYRFLLIKFDNNGVVAGYELSSSEGSGCNRYGVCIRDSYYMLLAPEDEDRVVKQFDIPADRCGVYVYGTRRPAVILSEIPIWIDIWIDGRRVGWLLDKKQFFFLQLDQGAHQLAFRSPDVFNQKQIEFSCAAGDLYFFELKSKRSGLFAQRYWIEIEQRDAVKGRKAIGKRQLTLNITETSD